MVPFTFPDDASVLVIDGGGNKSRMTLGEAVSRFKIMRAHTGFDYALGERGEWVELGLRVLLLAFKHDGWSVTFYPPPIPTRTMDWQFSHDDFDASYEGEEDGWVGNGLSGYGASPRDALEQIADINADRAEAA